MRRLHSVMLAAAAAIGVTACRDALAADGAAALLAYESGPTMPVGPGEVFPEPLVVRVTDRSGRPVEGIELRWTIAAGGGALGRTTTHTDADGRSSNSYRLPTTTMVSVVRVQAPGFAIGVVDFRFSVETGGGGGGGGGAEP